MLTGGSPAPNVAGENGAAGTERFHTETTRTLSVALMIGSDGPGGAEYMIIHLAEALARRGHRVLLVTKQKGSGWLPGQFVERGLPYALHSTRHYLDPRATTELAAILRHHEVDVLHSHEFSFAVYGALASLGTRLPHVITFHGGTYFADRWRRRVISRAMIRLSRATVAVSSALRERLAAAAGLSPTAIHVVPNGVPVRTGDPARVRAELLRDSGEALIVAVGNLYPVKGHQVLIEALALLHAGAPQLRWRLAIAGRGGEEPNLRAHADSRAIGDRVSLLGFRSDVQDLLAAADVFAMPSLSEGMPLALIEAMAAGRAIVASNVGGIPEVVTHDRDAVLVPPSEPEALAEALRLLLESRERRDAFGAAARATALKHFTLDAMCDRYERLYRGADS